MKIAVPDLVSNSYFPAIAAVELGCFHDAGLDMEVEVIFPANRAQEMLRDGEVDLVASCAHAAVAAFPNWEGVRLLCAQSRGMYWFLVMHRDFEVKRGDLSVLRGKRIGAAPWVDMGLRQMLAAAGMAAEANDIEIGPVPKVADVGPNFGLGAYKALEARAIDGFWANGMAAELAVAHGVGDILIDARRGDGPASAFGLTFASIAASETGLADNPDLGPAAIRAIEAAQRLLREDVSRAERVGRRYFPDEEARLIAGIVERDLPWYEAAIRPEDIAGVNGLLRALGHLDRDVPFEEIVFRS